MAIPLCYDPMAIPQCHGGFADVWKGRYRDREVAAKALRVYETSDFEQIRKVSDPDLSCYRRIDSPVQRFCREVVTWKALCHPNVLPLLGVTMTRNKFVMVSEWMENGNINVFMKTHPDVNRLELVCFSIGLLIYTRD